MRYTYDQPDYLDKNGLIHLVDELRTLIEEIVNGNLDVSVYATKEDLSAYAKTTDIPSLDGYATKSYVDENIADVATNGEIDLSNYVTKDAVYTKEETDAKITEIDVITEDEIRSLFTEEGFATTSYVDTAVSNVPATDLSNYYTKDETYSKSEVDALVGGSTDEGGSEEGGGETTTPTTGGTITISGNTTLKSGFERTYTAKFADADGNEVTGVTAIWELTGDSASVVEKTDNGDNTITLYYEDEDYAETEVVLSASEASGAYTPASITITLGYAF